MTVTNTSTLSIFTSPLTVPVAPPNTNANSVDATSASGTQLGGVFTTYSTTNFESAPQNVVLTGIANRLNLGGGAANVAVLGGGQIVESAQFLGTDSGKLISIEMSATNNADDAAVTGATVNLGASVAGNTVGSSSTILAAGGNMSPNPTNFYVHGGTGDDTIIGSFLNDFIRGGAGDDVINAFGGNDLVRGGSGSDSIDLGAGLDTLYYTSDQVVTGDSDSLTNFISGDDRLVFENAIDSTLVFSNGDDLTGYKTITFTSGTQSTTLNVVSGAIKKSDITFLS